MSYSAMTGRSLVEASGNIQRVQQQSKTAVNERSHYLRYSALPAKRSSTPQSYINERSSRQSEAFQFDLDRHLSANAYDMLSTLSSESEPENTLEAPREPPATLPPIPVLPDSFPLPIHDLYMQQRSPILLQSSSRKISPISIDNPVRKMHPSAHQKTASQKYLLPMPRPDPHLTLDKPQARKDRVVQVHLMLLGLGIFFPPLLLCLAFGVFDEVCYLGPKAGLLGDAAGVEGQVRRIKKAAVVVGTMMLLACVAGVIAGFIIA